MDDPVQLAIRFYLIIGMALALLVYLRKNQGGHIAALTSAVLVTFLWLPLLLFALVLGPDR